MLKSESKKCMRIILIEDNPQVRELVKSLLAEHHPEAVVVGEADGIANGHDLLTRVPADLWLLDIELRDGSVFALLDGLDPTLLENTALVFLTAFGTYDYVIEALRKSAVDYLLKPVDPEKLSAALAKVWAKLPQRSLHKRLDDLRGMLQNELKPLPKLDKIPLFLPRGIVRYVAVDDICYIKADKNMAYVYTASEPNKQISTVRGLGDYKRTLIDRCGFVLIEKSLLVNSKYIARYEPLERSVELTNGTTVSASRDGGRQLLEYFRSIFRTGG